jgi:saposin
MKLKPKVVKITVHKPRQDINCDMCTYAIGSVEDWLAANATEQQIEQNLEQFCALFPDEQQCDQVIVSEVPQIVKWIEQNETPTQVCDQLGLCNSTRFDIMRARIQKLKAKLLQAKAKAKLVKKPRQDINCDMCTYAVGSVEDWLAANATEQQIEQNLEQFCALFPDEQQCDQVIVSEVPQIVKWIEQNETPTQVCDQLGLCNSTRVLPKVGDAPCFGCEALISSVESWVEDNATEQEIVVSLDTVCTLVPSLQTQCDAVVAEGVTNIVTYIEKDETPEQVCQQIGFCSSNRKPKTQAPSNKMHKIRI